MEKLASEKQKRWIKHWLEEQKRSLKFYTNKKFKDLTIGDAGLIIGDAKKEIEHMGYSSTDEYITETKNINLGKKITYRDLATIIRCLPKQPIAKEVIFLKNKLNKLLEQEI